MPKKQETRNYPDVSHLLASYEADRRKLAALSWEEKVAIIERLRDELRFASAAELADQIARDVDETRRSLRG